MTWLKYPWVEGASPCKRRLDAGSVTEGLLDSALPLAVLACGCVRLNFCP